MECGCGRHLLGHLLQARNQYACPGKHLCISVRGGKGRPKYGINVKREKILNGVNSESRPITRRLTSHPPRDEQQGFQRKHVEGGVGDVVAVLDQPGDSCWGFS